MKQDWLAQLLEAEPDELRGLGDTKLARRIRRDDDLRMAAASILQQQHALSSALAAIALRQPANAEPAGVQAQGASAIAVARSHRVQVKHARSVRSRRARSLAVASLAAAALLTLLITRPDARVPASPGAQSTSLTARLDAASDRPFAVFATDNPDIAIVWLFNKED